MSRSISPFRPLRPGLVLAGLAFSLLTLPACSGPDHAVTHRGLSPDGYGFVKNGPTLAPPAHLLQHQSLPSDAASTSPATTATPAAQH